jgi:hypothetical protein
MEGKWVIERQYTRSRIHGILIAKRGYYGNQVIIG